MTIDVVGDGGGQQQEDLEGQFDALEGDAAAVRGNTACEVEAAAAVIEIEMLIFCMLQVLAAIGEFDVAARGRDDGGSSFGSVLEPRLMLGFFGLITRVELAAGHDDTPDDIGGHGTGRAGGRVSGAGGIIGAMPMTTERAVVGFDDHTAIMLGVFDAEFEAGVVMQQAGPIPELIFDTVERPDARRVNGWEEIDETLGEARDRVRVGVGFLGRGGRDRAAGPGRLRRRGDGVGFLGDGDELPVGVGGADVPTVGGAIDIPTGEVAIAPIEGG